MRCHICNSVLSHEEVEYDKRYKDEKYGPYVPCQKCIAVIDDVFEHDDTLTNPEPDEVDDWEETDDDFFP